MVIAKTPEIVKALYSQLTWEIPNEKNVIYLTFDDGPTPGITENILEILKKYQAYATFFCIGKKYCQ